MGSLVTAALLVIAQFTFPQQIFLTVEWTNPEAVEINPATNKWEFFGVPVAEIAYHVQVSQDNGVTWRDYDTNLSTPQIDPILLNLSGNRLIISDELIEEGQYEYKVRVRPVKTDGTLYGAWAESDAKKLGNWLDITGMEIKLIKTIIEITGESIEQ